MATGTADTGVVDFGEDCFNHFSNKSKRSGEKLRTGEKLELFHSMEILLNE